MAYLRAGKWEIDANGVKGTLAIAAVDELGRVSGTLFERKITGWWSERARRLSFLSDGPDTTPNRASRVMPGMNGTVPAPSGRTTSPGRSTPSAAAAAHKTGMSVSTNLGATHYDCQGSLR